jgi:hypothetical protein
MFALTEAVRSEVRRVKVSLYSGMQGPAVMALSNLRAYGFALAAFGLLACSAAPQKGPLETRAVPASAKRLERCSAKGEMLCSVMSTLSEEYSRERRPACSAYLQPNGTQVEVCGSLPASQP